MSRTLNASFELEKNLLQSQGMRILHEVQVQLAINATPALYEYWAEHNASVAYFKPETNTAQTYSPFPVRRGDIEMDDGTKVPSLSLNIGAVDQTIQGYLENVDGLRRCRVRSITVPANKLTNASAYLLDTYYIDGCTIDHGIEEAVFELTSKGQVSNVTVPLRHFRRDHCPFQYTDASTCQDDSGDSACKHTKADCASKDNVINFGGFPGIGTKNVHF